MARILPILFAALFAFGACGGDDDDDDDDDDNDVVTPDAMVVTPDAVPEPDPTWANFAAYQRRAANRQIPVMVLSRAD